MFGLQPMDALGPDCRVMNRVPLTAGLANAPLNTMIPIAVSTGPFDPSQPFIKAIIVDLETTGLDIERHEAIEVSLVKVGIQNGRLVRIASAFQALRQPTRSEITQEITDITGITYADVRGKEFNREAIAHFIEDIDYFLAHNADFDRPFFDRDVMDTEGKIWGCTSKGGEINWKALGYKSAGLENIVAKQGFFYDAHRALIDCLATAWALNQEPAAVAQLVENINSGSAKLQAWGSPFSAKDELKKRGYSWNMTDKVWEKTFISTKAAEAERELLEKEVYRGAMRAATISEKQPHEKYRRVEPK